jgi:hypothetical protein
MTPIQKQFFALVQSGLWGTPVDTTLFNIQTDWAQLYQSAKVQATRHHIRWYANSAARTASEA